MLFVLKKGNYIIVVTNIKCTSVCICYRKELWSMKMNDSVLDFVGYQSNIICALADGYIAAISITSDRSSPNSDPILYRIGSTAVQCISISPFNHVWVGCGKAITILEARWGRSTVSYYCNFIVS